MQKTDYDAIVKNARFFKEILKGSCLCAVLKNNAYGHGLVRTASALCGVADWFAVGSVDEALEAEQFCPNVLILLPLTDKTQIKTAVLHNFALTVDSFYTLDLLRLAVPRGKKARAHIKINTGMNRLGFAPNLLPQFVSEDFSVVNIEGVFSHFWGETASSCDNQLAIFLRACDTLCAGLARPLIRHIANTSGVLLSEKYHLDMARVGLGIYGYGGENLFKPRFDAKNNLIPAKTVTAKVLAVHEVRAGETVGYGAAYTFKRDSRVAVVNAGYATGLPRALKNPRVKIGNGFFGAVGNVCMAMLAVDVGAADVRVGDEVILLGKELNNANSEVIIYELLCNLK